MPQDGSKDCSPNLRIALKTDGTADLLFVRNDGLRFVPVVTPLNFQSHYSGETHLRVTAIAKGLDCESNVVRLRIDWDGVWEREDMPMKRHFVIAMEESE